MPKSRVSKTSFPRRRETSVLNAVNWIPACAGMTVLFNAPTPRSSLLAPRVSARSGISLIEVLISMFVLLFGLMGVAAIFPVGSHYVIEGEKFDLASGIAQNAFEELKGRGMLRPEAWMYADNPIGPEELVPNLPMPPYPQQFPLVMQDENGPNPGRFNVDITNNDHGPGHAFVLDPLGTANLIVDPLRTDNMAELRFPYAMRNLGNNYTNLWFQYLPPVSYMAPQPLLSGRTWPVRRITVPVPDPTGNAAFIPMPGAVAETIFRLRDDLAVEQPDESDVPSIQRWDTADINPVTGNANNTPSDMTDDSLLRRQYKGNYSWLATIVPTTRAALEALQPSHESYGQIACDVSVVVYRKRDETPSDASERFILGELLQGGELVIFSLTANSSDAKADVDKAVDGVRPGTWIALAGVNQSTGDFVLKWYRILSLDDETVDIDVLSTGNTQMGRRITLIGPDWPASPQQQAAGFVNGIGVCIFPDAVSVVTKPLKMENTSLWNLQ